MSSKNPSQPDHTAAEVITPDQLDAWFALLFAHASVTDRVDRDLQEQHGRASRLVQELVDAGHLQRGADQGDGRRSLISFTPAGRRYSLKVARTFEAAILRYFIDPLDEEDIAAIVRIWDKLRAAQAQELAPVSS
jgi:DNA-binding MarR family transcriptional regulator